MLYTRGCSHCICKTRLLDDLAVTAFVQYIERMYISIVIIVNSILAVTVF